MAEKFKEPRFYMCIVLFVLFFLPWCTIEGSSSVGGFEASASAGGTSGFVVLGQFITGYLVVLFPIAMIVLHLIPNLKLNLKLIYLLGGILSIILTIVSVLFMKSHASTSVEVMGASASSEAKMGVVFWLEILLLVAIIIFTIIKDFALDKSIKENGIKGALTEMASQVKDETASMTENIANGGLQEIGANIQGGIQNIASGSTCPNCGAKVALGKKFCAKCGSKMPEQTNLDDNNSSSENGNTPSPKSKSGLAPNSLIGGKSIFSLAGQTQKTKFITVEEYLSTFTEFTCTECGTSVASGIKFCPECGAKMTMKVMPEKCDKCDADLIPDKKYCPDCGSAVAMKELKTNCDKCNALLYFGKKYCVECGTKIEA